MRNPISIIVCLFCFGGLTHISTTTHSGMCYVQPHQQKLDKESCDMMAYHMPRCCSSFVRANQEWIILLYDAYNQLLLVSNNTLSQLYLSLANLYLPSAADANPECTRDLKAIGRGILSPNNNTQWALRVVDSWGKYHDGILEGSFLFPGFFQDCLDVAVDSKQLQAEFTGQYCTLNYKNKISNKQTEVKDDSFQLLNAPHRLGMPYVSAFAMKNMLDRFYYGTCMPSTCTKKELVRNINHALSFESLEVSVAECSVARQSIPLKAPHIIGIILFSFIAIILVLATIIGVFSKHMPSLSSGILKYLLVFSVSDNLVKIFSLTDTKKTSTETISCLHGIRFLSICWVILGHQYAFSVEAAVNQYDLLKIIKPASFQVVTNAFMSVDTFFFLSGLLVCYGFLKQQQTGRFSIVVYYIHRVVRLLPSILVLTAFLATLSELIISTSPYSWMWHQNVVENCRNHWWWDSTFATNFLQVFLKQGSCISKYQFCAIFLLTIFTILRSAKMSLSLLLIWISVFCIVPAAIIGAYNLPPMSILSDPRTGDYSNKVYFMTWARASPYLIGVLTGYILHKNAQREIIPNASNKVKFAIFIGWILALIVNAAVVFGMWKYNQFVIPLENYNKIPYSVSLLYGGLHRAVWAVSLSWIVCCCHWGYGGPINWLLSHSMWQPFSRLTYCFYLTSLPVQSALFSTTYRPTYYNNVTKIQEICGVLFFTFLSSVVLSLISEVPFINLEKLILEKFNMNRNGCGEYREIAVLVEEETTERGRGDGNGNTEVEQEFGEQELITGT
ncbi:unnamed protein product, partial [Meganyctiphanes norvegica]